MTMSGGRQRKGDGYEQRDKGRDGIRFKGAVLQNTRKKAQRMGTYYNRWLGLAVSGLWRVLGIECQTGGQMTASKCGACQWNNSIGHCSIINTHVNKDQPACGKFRSLPAGMKSVDDRDKGVTELAEKDEGKKLSFKAALDDVPKANYIALEEGVTTVTILGDDVEERTNSFNKLQYYFRAKVNGQEGIWSITKNSPLARQVLEHLAKGRRHLVVVRAGKTQADTKYSIKSASK